MPEVDPRLVAAFRAQLGLRDEALAAGAERVGWKLGMGERERIGGSIAVGHLTSASRLPCGATYEAHAVELHADAEVAVRLADAIEAGAVPEEARGAIDAFAIALELVDLGTGGDAAEIVATNVFHRALVLGEPRPMLPEDEEVRLSANGLVCVSGTVTEDLAPRLGAAADVLASVGQRLEAGDWIITGSVVQIAVAPGDDVAAEAAGLGRAHLRVVDR